jgi:hypothetical protein
MIQDYACVVLAGKGNPPGYIGSNPRYWCRDHITCQIDVTFAFRYSSDGNPPGCLVLSEFGLQDIVGHARSSDLWNILLGFVLYNLLRKKKKGNYPPTLKELS